MNKTESEILFEMFLAENEISFEQIPRAKHLTPDYLVTLNDCKIAVEVTTIHSIAKGDPVGGNTRTIGKEIRREINDKSKQLRRAIERDLPTLLLLCETNGVRYPLFLEEHDFTTAMYGAYTIQKNRQTSIAGAMYNGWDAQLRPGANRDHFSALGRIHVVRPNVISCSIFPNIYATRPVKTNSWPSAFSVAEFELEHIDVAPRLV